MTAATGRPRPAASSVLIDGVRFDAITERDVVSVVRKALAAGRGGTVLTPNVDILRTLRSPGRRGIADSADLVVADGAPIVWASRLLGTPLPGRVAGADLVQSLTRAAAEDDRSVYLLGGEDGVARRGADVLRQRLPGIRVVGWHRPPHGFERDEVQSSAIVHDILSAGPDLVLVGLGFPKQELLAEKLRQHLPSTWFLGCGAGLDFLSGDVRRAPRQVQDMGMEWMFRLAHEPRRLARRYLVNDLPYAFSLLARSALTGSKVRRSAA